MATRPGRRSSAEAWDDPLARLPQREPVTPRLYVREPGWSARIKEGSERVFCYLAEPGAGHYHRLSDGELHLQQGDIKLCLRCADRLGLLHFEPKRLKEPSLGVDVRGCGDDPGYELRAEGTSD
ncbi:MAG: hypothetical protein KatS3mg108_3718 [Isosphaeraceae bacterium]|nr:MAG: hypothetical protein KatS3mg108_3718 [Isosphaeraceae bacterium]